MRRAICFIVLLTVLIVPLGQSFAQDATPPATPETTEPTLLGIKDYLAQHGQDILGHVIKLQADAQAYFNLIQSEKFDYKQAWADHQADLTQIVLDARTQFVGTHTNGYEEIEGIVGGVPSLSKFDSWIDASLPGKDDPSNAYDWTLKLDDGRSFDKPGNILHYVLEVTLWGTEPDHTGLRVDLNGDGKDDLGDALPDAHFFLAGANAFVDAATQLNTAIAAWTPTLEDSFTALAVMVPTEGDLFQDWKNSIFIGGSEPIFVSQSRLVDVIGITSSLQIIYTDVSPQVAAKDATLDQQIQAGFTDLLGFIKDTHQQELDGKKFTPEQVDGLGQEAQDKADALAALIGQAASDLNLTLPSLQQQ
ncbi:MAG TPA: imelysin family protein [Phototrophicaceae bacterium]|nr:imelysin family protein [Phototrophicaceae bacterium]